MESNTEDVDFKDNWSIIKRLNEGNTGVFEKVYRYYFPKLYTFGLRYVEASESEEIVQDTMVWLWENRTSIVPTLTLSSLLFTIVKNKSLNRISHLEIKRKVLDEIVAKYDDDFSCPDFYNQSELFEVYKKALDALPPKSREVYDMNRHEGLTHKEIAARLNVSSQTVNYRMGQTLKILRAALKDFLPILVPALCLSI